MGQEIHARRITDFGTGHETGAVAVVGDDMEGSRWWWWTCGVISAGDQFECDQGRDVWRDLGARPRSLARGEGPVCPERELGLDQGASESRDPQIMVAAVECAGLEHATGNDAVVSVSCAHAVAGRAGFPAGGRVRNKRGHAVLHAIGLCAAGGGVGCGGKWAMPTAQPSPGKPVCQPVESCASGYVHPSKPFPRSQPASLEGMAWLGADSWRNGYAVVIRDSARLSLTLTRDG